MSSYQRTYKLQFSARDGTNLVLSQTLEQVGLMLDFQIEKSTSSEANVANITITNPSDDTIGTLQKEGIVILELGYAGDNAIIFTGEKEAVNYTYESGTKRLELNLLEGTSNYTNLNFSKNYPIGTTNLQIISDSVLHLIANVPSIQASNAYLISDLKIYTRPQIVSGNAYDILKSFLDPIDYQYFVANGTISIIPQNGFVKDLQVSISSRSGLIGSPKPISENDKEDTAKNGVEFESILNYNFDVGRLVKIDSKSFTSKILKIRSVTHVGNTFEGEYKSIVRAFEVDGI